jgi:hypothetical protein
MKPRLFDAVGLIASALAVCAVGFVGLEIVPAIAQTIAEKTPDTTIEIPVGEWITAAGGAIGPLIVLVVGWLIRQLPGQFAAVLSTMRVDQLLDKAISYGINATAGAMKGKALSVDVGSEVLENALQYVVDNGPKMLIKWMGGEAGIREKIIARLELDETASVDPRDPGYIK